MLLSELEKCYIPSGSLTVDQQLIPTRGRCTFHQHIPNKPGKYGIKIFSCCNSSNVYPLKGEVYLSSQSQVASTGSSKDRIRNAVKLSVNPWINSERTVTTDDYFIYQEKSSRFLYARFTHLYSVCQTTEPLVSYVLK